MARANFPLLWLATGPETTTPPPATSWLCSVETKVTTYANGDLKVTLRCPAASKLVKGEVVRVSKT